MNKIKIVIGYEFICLWDKWLESAMAEEYESRRKRTYGEASVLATVTSFRIQKLHPKTHFVTNKNISFTLDAATALALADFLYSCRLPANSYLGNGLLKIIHEIDQHFQ